MKQSVRLIHWHAEEAKKRGGKLRAAGYRVSHEPLDGAAALRALAAAPPAALVVDLSRQPSHGRDLAVALRIRKGTRHVPLVFVAGEPQKVERIKQLLPDAVYTSWSRISSALHQAIANPPADPVVPSSGLAGYSGTPLPKKLGIKAGSTVALIGAPDSFVKTIGKLPAGVTLRSDARARCDLVVWFVGSSKDLERRIVALTRAVAEKGGLWVAWPKKASGVASDLTQAVVRRIGLASGLVDYKICSIDDTWSGLLFTRR